MTLGILRNSATLFVGKIRQKTALDPARRFPYLPATTRAAGLSPSPLRCDQHTNVSTSGWVCPGNFRGSCGPAKRAGGMDAGRTLRLHRSQGSLFRRVIPAQPAASIRAATQGGESAGQGRLEQRPTAFTRERPIAPGKDWRPLPPWDPTFPGAFFCASDDQNPFADRMMVSPKLAARRIITYVGRMSPWKTIETLAESKSLNRRKRRWFQFSLRSLMIAVTLLALLSGYVARQYAFVQERQRLLDEERTSYGTSDDASDIPWIRQLLGDQAIRVIGLDPETDKAKQQRVASLFPEAEICAVRVVHAPNGAEIGLKQVPFSDERPSALQSNSPSRP